ncbi:MAG: hemerythrin domain-containing protein [Ferruginibacter sp.]
MKAHKPIKRHQALVSFSKDHHFGLLLVWKIRQGLDNIVNPERISNYVLYCFEEDLQHHFKGEEQLMFCRLPADDVLRQQAENEHASIYGLVKQIVTNKVNLALLKQFADTLENHIRFEERILFPYMQEKLQPGDLEVISTYEGALAGDVDSRWGDRFWEKKLTPP